MSQDKVIHYWIRIIEKYEASGLTVRQFAMKHGLPVGRILYWLFRLDAEADRTASQRSAKAIESSNEIPRGLIVVWVIPKCMALVVDRTIGQGVLCKLLDKLC